MRDGSLRLPTSPMPALDGVRALAITAVFGVHLGLLPGGYAGVTLFFVLSGFLITTLLLAERERTGRIDLHGFYWRRAARLLPSFLLVLLVFTTYALVAGWDTRGTTVLVAVTSLFYVSNWAAFLANRFLGALIYTWSLGQEEQYYLLAPLVVRRLTAERAPHRLRRTGCIVLAAAGVLVVLRIGLLLAFPNWWISTYYNPIVNLDGLALGSGLALVLYDRSARVAPALSGTALSVAALACFAVSCAVLPLSAHGVLVAVPVSLVTATVLLLALTADAKGPISRLAAFPLFTWIGRRSYTIYLVQVPLLYVLRPWKHGSVGVELYAWDALAVLLALGWAALSYPVEQHIRRRVAAAHPDPGRRVGRVTASG